MSGEKEPLLGSCRLVLTVMVFFGVYHLMALRFNLSMALVCMTEDPTEKSSNESGVRTECPADPVTRQPAVSVTDHQLPAESKEFEWSKSLQGLLLSCFFYGYILTQIIGGYFSDKFGGKTVFLVGMLTLSSTSIMIPVLARTSPYLVVAVRIIQGLASGLSFPSLYNLFSVWTTPEERATLMSLAYAGVPTATVLTFPFSSWLCQSGLDGGWPLTFYVPGTTGLVWCLLFYLLVYSSPATHPRISASELQFLSSALSPTSHQRLNVPWRQMMGCPAVHALWLTHLCSAFGFYLLTINLTLFIREALGFSVTENGLLSMLPTLGMLLLSSAGKSFDMIRARNCCSVTTLRKIFNSIGFFCPAMAFIGIQFLPCNYKVGHVVLISLGMALHQLSISGGFYFSHAEVAGPYSGVLFGITNTMAQIPGFLTPVIVSSLTTSGEMSEWYQVFSLAGVIYVVGGLVYLWLGTSHTQQWAGQQQKLRQTAHCDPLLASSDTCHSV